MKKTILMLVVSACSVLVILTEVSYANQYKDTITNWKTFYQDDNIILSYEYDDEKGANIQQSTKLHVIKNANGYIYFYVKKEAPEATKHKVPAWNPDNKVTNYSELLVLRTTDYVVFLDKIDCQREVLTEEDAYEVLHEIQELGGSKTIRPYDATDQPSRNIFIKQNEQYSGIPFRVACESFSKTWKEEEEREKAEQKKNDEFYVRSLQGRKL